MIKINTCRRSHWQVSKEEFHFYISQWIWADLRVFQQTFLHLTQTEDWVERGGFLSKVHNYFYSPLYPSKQHPCFICPITSFTCLQFIPGSCFVYSIPVFFFSNVRFIEAIWNQTHVIFKVWPDIIYSTNMKY